MSRGGLLGAGIAALVLLMLAFSAIFTVEPWQQALVLQFGEPRQVIAEPGLHFKLPLLQSVSYFDKRVLDLDARAPDATTLDQKQLQVDAYARYRITDSLRFFQAVNNEQGVEVRLGSIINAALRNIISEQPLITLLTPERAALMRRITEVVDNEVQGLGIKVLDVRLKRIDLPEANTQAVVHRMQTQRGQEARKIRAEGDKEARRIHADADLQERVILAEARKQAEILHGQGDAEAQRIYNASYGKDVQFFDFWRSLQALSTALPKDTTTYVGPPEGDFFRFFGHMNGSPTTGGASAAAPAAEPAKP
ncbi:MAG: protease modulator HflC [Alphaproteobacteria bacterium]